MPHVRPLLLALFAVALTACARAAPDAPPIAATEVDFCIDFQQQLSRVPLNVINQVHDDWEAFVLSKPSIEPLVIHQMAFTGVAGGSAETVSCKLKGPDHLAEIHGEHNVVTGLTCRDFNRQIVDGQVAALLAEGLTPVLDPEAFVFVADEQATRGTQWLSSKPWQAVRTGEQGGVEIAGKAMSSPLRTWLPVPRSWRGMFYCHLIAPEHARALLSGEVTSPPRS
jgi:hypothetical protein